MTLMRRHPVWAVVLGVHAGVVLLLTVLFLALALPSLGEPDANIGAGIVLLPLEGLGLPWTLPQFVDPYRFDSLPRGLHLLLAVGPAILNVVLHAVVFVAVGRRGARRSRTQAPLA